MLTLIINMMLQKLTTMDTKISKLGAIKTTMGKLTATVYGPDDRQNRTEND